MNKLSRGDRAGLLGLMVEGVLIRAISRLTGTSKNTIVVAVGERRGGVPRSRRTPAMAVGVTGQLWELADVVQVLEEREAAGKEGIGR